MTPKECAEKVFGLTTALDIGAAAELFEMFQPANTRLGDLFGYLNGSIAYVRGVIEEVSKTLLSKGDRVLFSLVGKVEATLTSDPIVVYTWDANLCSYTPIQSADLLLKDGRKLCRQDLRKVERKLPPKESNEQAAKELNSAIQQRIESFLSDLGMFIESSINDKFPNRKEINNAERPRSRQ